MEACGWGAGEPMEGALAVEYVRLHWDAFTRREMPRLRATLVPWVLRKLLIIILRLEDAQDAGHGGSFGVAVVSSSS